MIHTKLRAEVLLTEMPRFLDGDLAARCLGVKLAQIRIRDRVPREIQAASAKFKQFCGVTDGVVRMSDI